LQFGSRRTTGQSPDVLQAASQAMPQHLPRFC
jgi:hypothetical protein